MNTETETIIMEKERIYEELQKGYKYMDVPVDSIQASDIKMLHFMICMEPDSIFYGLGLGLFLYKNMRIFEFRYNIHTLYSKGPHLSNRMTNLEEVLLDDCHGVIGVRNVETSFGKKAFWKHTPMSYLNDKEKSVRELIQSIQSYCRREKLCEKLRKTDKRHEKFVMQHIEPITSPQEE